MRRTKAEVLFELDDERDRYLPEGPREMVVGGIPRVLWVNIQLSPDLKWGCVFLGSERGIGSITAPGRLGFLLPIERAESPAPQKRRVAKPRKGIATNERLLVGIEKQLKVFTFATGKFSDALATIPDKNRRTIINDAEVVPGGKAVVFGTKDTQFKEPIAHLYLYTVDDNRVSVLADKQTCSNGKVFASDARGLILYDIDTPTRKVVRYRLDVAGRVAMPDGTALDLADQPGFPDGMCDCGDGTVIVAFYNPDFVKAGRAVRFNLTTGEAVEEWTTPGSPRVTCPLLVKRPDGVKLILTTATEGMPAEMRAKCPNAGCLFIADTQLETCPAPEVVRLP